MKNRNKRGGVGDEVVSRGEKEKRGEPGYHGVLPGVCVVHAFQPEGSKPGKRGAHTHNCIHTDTQVPKVIHLLNAKTLFMHTRTIRCIV